MLKKDIYTYSYINLFGMQFISIIDTRTGSKYISISDLCRELLLNNNQRDRQVRKIKENDFFKIGYIVVPEGVGNDNFPTACLELSYVPMWLANFDISSYMKEYQPETVTKVLSIKNKILKKYKEKFYE